MLKVSQSKVKTWRRCKQEFHFKYNEGLRRKRKKRAFTFGSTIHAMLEGHAIGEDPFDVLKDIEKKNGKMFAAEIDEYGDIIGDSEVIMREYFDYWGDDEINHLRINGRYAEHQFEVEIAKGIVATGRIDFIAKHKKLRVLGEHKTFSRMMNDDDRWRNVQSPVYMRVIEMMGWKPVEGTLWDNVRSKAPPIPEVLKSGKLSKSKIDTLPSQYMKAIIENKLDPDDYEDVMETLRANRSQWFVRNFTPYNKTTVDEVFRDFVTSAQEIERHGQDRPVANIGLNCGMCDFEPLCRARFQDMDVDFIKEREYTNEREEELLEVISD